MRQVVNAMMGEAAVKPVASGKTEGLQLRYHPIGFTRARPGRNWM